MEKMTDITRVFRDLCDINNYPFEIIDNVKSYDDTTLFCPAGMQKYKKDFSDLEIKGKTVGNIQSCLRLVDYDEIGDGTHCLCFDMIGLFSFRDITLQKAVDFWMTYMKNLNVKIDFITIHPDKFDDWKYLYDNYPVELRKDPGCIWSDGSSAGSYCTEFYHIRNGQEIEVGNIVNPQDSTCIDAGFGWDRLDSIVNGTPLRNQSDVMAKAIKKLLDSGFVPSGHKHGSILRKLYRDFIKKGFTCDEEHALMTTWYHKETERIKNAQNSYINLKKKHPNKDASFWMETFGIDINDIN
jgi:alanyl-tRNA synthetase